MSFRFAIRSRLFTGWHKADASLALPRREKT